MNVLPEEFFKRVDERPDSLYYRRPVETNLLSEQAMRQLRATMPTLLGAPHRVLDLMAGVRSHIGTVDAHVTGLGMNLDELQRNPHVDTPVVHDLNRTKTLPFEDRSFDAALCTVAVQYMTQPVQTFREVGRVLKPGSPFVVAFNARMFEDKAILAWRASDEDAHCRLVTTYFEESGAFADLEVKRMLSEDGDTVVIIRGVAEQPTAA